MPARKQKKVVVEPQPEPVVSEISDESDVSDSDLSDTDANDINDSKNSSTENENESPAEQKQLPKTKRGGGRKGKGNLTDVLNKLLEHETKIAIEMLKKYIDAYGDEPGTKKKKRGAKKEDSQLNEYQLFIRNKMAEIRLNQPDVASNQVMKMAVNAWNDRKNAVA